MIRPLNWARNDQKGNVTIMSKSTPLPTKLKTEPLIDAVVEMRFSSNVALSSILPGLLYSQLPGEKILEQLPAMSIPKEFREIDPSLKFAALTRINWGDYFIMIGDSVFSVASKIPYNGWLDFKAAILTAFSIVCRSEFIKSVERYSMKYVDMISPSAEDPILNFNLSLMVGGIDRFKNFMSRVEIIEPGILHCIQITSLANLISQSGSALSGSVIDVDSIVTINGEAGEVFFDQLDSRLESLHSSNKRMFFSCISDSALTKLEPEYA